MSSALVSRAGNGTLCSPPVFVVSGILELHLGAGLHIDAVEQQHMYQKAYLVKTYVKH